MEKRPIQIRTQFRACQPIIPCSEALLNQILTYIVLVIRQNAIHTDREFNITFITDQADEGVFLTIHYTNADLSRNLSRQTDVHNNAVDKFRDLNLLLAELLAESSHIKMEYKTGKQNDGGEVILRFIQNFVSR
jgi:hypothetical protein